MSQFRLITVGRARDARMVGILEEYLKRLRPLGFTWEVAAEEPFRKGTEERALAKEQERLLGRINVQDFVILLDVAGEMVDSPGLADRLREWRDASRPVVLVVGGSLGVGDAVRQRAQWRWSLSPLTLPHGLAHIVAIEQLYRAWTILQGHPYHK
ncbi:MAG: 23S rRNA (pseudouridine(1915)-N(3))-methyltransferase RlmH [Firmicutes bacterium]|nr:23S rRNA (pseudouridine(1915)-N(3))-methyltransferase RlmH [Bacillota bacterium]